MGPGAVPRYAKVDDPAEHRCLELIFEIVFMHGQTGQRHHKDAEENPGSDIIALVCKVDEPAAQPAASTQPSHKPPD